MFTPLPTNTVMVILKYGIYTSMKYYLRFVADYKQFIHVYTKNLIVDANNSAEIRDFHIAKWKNILKEHSIE
jgi:hypothetical protein